MCELKPCPFCGKNELRQLGVLKKVQCINESCDHAFKNQMLPIAWQTRPIEDKLRAENEIYKIALQKIACRSLESYADYEMSDVAYCMRDKAREALKEVKE